LFRPIIAQRGARATAPWHPRACARRAAGAAPEDAGFRHV